MTDSMAIAIRVLGKALPHEHDNPTCDACALLRRMASALDSALASRDRCANCQTERRDHDALGLCPDAAGWPELPPRKFRAERHPDQPDRAADLE